MFAAVCVVPVTIKSVTPPPPPPLMFSVTAPPVLLAVTPVPTKSKLVTEEVNSVPSS